MNDYQISFKRTILVLASFVALILTFWAKSKQKPFIIGGALLGRWRLAAGWDSWSYKPCVSKEILHKTRWPILFILIESKWKQNAVSSRVHLSFNKHCMWAMYFALSGLRVFRWAFSNILRPFRAKGRARLFFLTNCAPSGLTYYAPSGLEVVRDCFL